MIRLTPDATKKGWSHPREVESFVGLTSWGAIVWLGTAAMSLIHITKQLALFLENRPGALARVCQTLRDAKINIYAISTGDTVDHNVIRMVVSDTARTLEIFAQHGALVVETDVLMVEDDNKPGSLAAIAEKLAAVKVNIEYCYCATSPSSKKGLLILRVSDAKKALKVLNSTS